MTASIANVMPVLAEDKPVQKYPYAIFAVDEQAGITLTADSLTFNGCGYTNGVYSTTAQYPNINGTISDHDDTEADETAIDRDNSDKPFYVSRDMIYIHNKLMNSWLSIVKNGLRLGQKIYHLNHTSGEPDYTFDTIIAIDGTVRQIEGYGFKMISNPGLVNSDGDIYNYIR